MIHFNVLRHICVYSVNTRTMNGKRKRKEKKEGEKVIIGGKGIVPSF